MKRLPLRPNKAGSLLEAAKNCSRIQEKKGRRRCSCEVSFGTLRVWPVKRALVIVEYPAMVVFLHAFVNEEQQLGTAMLQNLPGGERVPDFARLQQ